MKITIIKIDNDESRVIWGGDQTINLFKSFKTAPNCIDLVFPNKVINC